MGNLFDEILAETDYILSEDSTGKGPQKTMKKIATLKRKIKSLKNKKKFSKKKKKKRLNKEIKLIRQECQFLRNCLESLFQAYSQNYVLPAPLEQRPRKIVNAISTPPLLPFRSEDDGYYE